MGNEYRNWSFLEWEDEIKKAGSKKNLAAALGISTDTIRKWMNKAKPKEEVFEEPTFKEPSLKDLHKLEKAFCGSIDDFETKFRKEEHYVDNENGRLQFSLKIRDKEAASFYRDKVLEKWGWSDEDLIRKMKLDNLGVEEFYRSNFGIFEDSKTPKEIQAFLDLLNSNSEDMNMLRAAANEAGKWTLAPKGGF